MKKVVLIFSLLALVLTSKGQSPTFSTDVESLESSMRTWTSKHGFSQHIKFDLSNNAAFFVKPDKDYVVFYIYDINPRTAVNFKAYLMTPSDSLKKKYSSKPYQVASVKSAKAEVLRFTTYKLNGAEQLPIKLEASPKAKMYVYDRKRQ